VVPEKYEVKLPDGVKVDPAIVERTAARARELGLSNEAGQTLLNSVAEEVITQRTAEDAARLADWSPGGASWKARDAEWRLQALADPEIGGSPAKLANSVELAQKVRRELGGKEFDQFLKDTGLGSHPAALKFLAKIGRGMSESTLVPASGSGATEAKTTAQKLYGDDGTGKK
jgi:hypothetical protein